MVKVQKWDNHHRRLPGPLKTGSLINYLIKRLPSPVPQGTMVVLESQNMYDYTINVEEGYGGVPHPPVLGRPTRPGTPLPAPPEWGVWP